MDDGKAPVPPGCNENADPKDSPKCVDDAYGVFVDATGGDDSRAGGRATPVKTIATALSKLGNKSRVYLCAGTYAESVKLTSAVSLYGGYGCATWEHDGSKAKLAPTAPGYALSVTDVTGPVVLADLEVVALPGTEAAPSSIAAFVSSSPSVRCPSR